MRTPVLIALLSWRWAEAEWSSGVPAGWQASGRRGLISTLAPPRHALPCPAVGLRCAEGGGAPLHVLHPVLEPAADAVPGWVGGWGVGGGLGVLEGRRRRRRPDDLDWMVAVAIGMPPISRRTLPRRSSTALPAACSALLILLCPPPARSAPPAQVPGRPGGHQPMP